MKLKLGTSEAGAYLMVYIVHYIQKRTYSGLQFNIQYTTLLVVVSQHTALCAVAFTLHTMLYIQSLHRTMRCNNDMVNTIFTIYNRANNPHVVGLIYNWTVR